MPRILRIFLIFAWAMVTFQLYAWTFGSRPIRYVDAPIENGKGYGDHEKSMVVGRDMQRQGALKALDKNVAELCSEQGRKRIVSGINEYYYHRQNQLLRYPETYGKQGAAYIASQYESSGDHRIERLTKERYRQGYLQLEDFKGYARQLIGEVVARESVAGKGCKA